jgi:hypothetical protein
MTIPTYLRFGLVVAASMLVTRAADQVQLDENLKELQKVIGKWETFSSDSEEAKNPGVYTVEADPGGRSLIASMSPRNLSKEPGAKPPFFVRNVLYFDPQAKRIVNVWVHSDGSSGKEIFPKHPDSEEFSVQGSGVLADGKSFTYTAHVKWLDPDKYVYWETDTTEGGEKKPDSPKYTMKRVKGS